MYFITTIVVTFFISVTQGLPAVQPYSVAVNITRYNHPLSGLGKIIGGAPVPEDEMLYMLSLVRYGEYVCGASAINSKWAITVAHCVKKWYDVSPEDITLWSGSKYRMKGIQHRVDKYVAHPNYYRSTLENDLAVLKVKDPFRVGNSRTFIQLIDADNCLRSNTELIVAGWGSTSKYGGGSDRLLKTNVTYIPNCKCREINDNLFGADDAFLTKGKMCSISKKNSPYKGDSGSPLVLRSVKGDKLVGIVSYGDIDNEGNILAIYTRVSNYVNWINKTIDGAGDGDESSSDGNESGHSDGNDHGSGDKCDDDCGDGSGDGSGDGNGIDKSG